MCSWVWVVEWLKMSVGICSTLALLDSKRSSAVVLAASTRFADWLTCLIHIIFSLYLILYFNVYSNLCVLFSFSFIIHGTYLDIVSIGCDMWDYLRSIPYTHTPLHYILYICPYTHTPLHYILYICPYTHLPCTTYCTFVLILIHHCTTYCTFVLILIHPCTTATVLISRVFMRFDGLFAVEAGFAFAVCLSEEFISSLQLKYSIKNKMPQPHWSVEMRWDIDFQGLGTGSKIPKISKGVAMRTVVFDWICCNWVAYFIFYFTGIIHCNKAT